MRRRSHPLPFLVSLTLLAAAPVRAAWAQACAPVEGISLKITSSPDDRRDRIVWKARDPGGGLLIDDPTAGTTTIELLDADGVVLTAETSPVDASGWAAGSSRWTYRDRRDPSPPDGIVRIVSRPTSFSFRGKGPALDEIRAPLPLPLTLRVTTSSGRCLEATFQACKVNDEAKVRCRASCAPDLLAPPAGADRTIVVDLAASAPWPDRLRAFNHDSHLLPAGAGCTDTATCGERSLELVDRLFDPRPGRHVRLWFKPSHWPARGFDASCDWLGKPTTVLDALAEHYASTGAEVMLVLLGQPAAFSSNCHGSCTDRLLPDPDQGCSCDHPGDAFANHTPHAYSPEWRQHWKCVLKHYAALGVRRFEIWNEPDVPSFFHGDAALEGSPSGPASLEPSFIEMFEQMRLALEEARDELDPTLAGQIAIGGPALSRVDSVIGSPARPAGPSFPPLLADVAAGPGDGDLDFLSAHYYTGDPGQPFAAGRIEMLRSFVPAAWSGVRLDIDEWNVGLGWQHPCQDADGDPANGWIAPEAGQDSSAGCDHRGAGYAAYMLAGFASQPDDVVPYVFEPFANGFAERCDMVETSLGLHTKHGLPKPMAAVHWAVSQMDWRLLDARQERLTDRSLGWIASLDRAGTVHVLIGQFDSTEQDHFTRHYASSGHDPGELPSKCGCASAAHPSRCVAAKFAAALADPDPLGRLQTECPGMSTAEASDGLAAATAAAARRGLEGTPATVALDVRGLSCQRRFTVEVFTTGPGQSTAALWRAMDGPHRQAGACTTALADAMDSYGYDWGAIQDVLWDAIRTPTATYTVAAGDPMPLLTVPAYGSVYVRIR